MVASKVAQKVALKDNKSDELTVGEKVAPKAYLRDFYEAAKSELKLDDWRVGEKEDHKVV